MRLFIMILVSAIIVIAIYLLIHRTMINRATLMLRKQAQAATDAAMAYALKQNLLQLPSMPESQLVADVWGKGVMVFEYSLDAPKVKTNELDAIRNKLAEALNEYAERNKLKGLNGLPCFVVSDIWTFAGVLHIDISHVVNQATVDYLHDVTKSEKD